MTKALTVAIGFTICIFVCACGYVRLGKEEPPPTRVVCWSSDSKTVLVELMGRSVTETLTSIVVTDPMNNGLVEEGTSITILPGANTCAIARGKAVAAAKPAPAPQRAPPVATPDAGPQTDAGTAPSAPPPTGHTKP